MAMTMKGSGAFVAAASLLVAASSTIALSGSSSPSLNAAAAAASSAHHQVCSAVPSGASGKDKFAPKFDGLRFIETLVTAHR
ncbi:OLC1v1028824C1 [Oldenlandia corymbosa var. corymbosa]|uniref:OLC1v1028824C1 n=1 Tax=Oldenlandia corymbosa var. corymbosa TaxID=529605 RepID=A0AAV1CCM3_OLDCO|nr:OLC1v1028824C1 [Oldenlandia corymbosa var. corymbosa]